MKNKELYKTVDEIAKEMLLLYAVMESDGDLIDESYLINVKKYNNFNQAIKVLLDLKANGKCDFEAMDIRKKYNLHTIYITWNLTDDFWVYIDDGNKTEIKMLLDLMDECLIRGDKANVWQLSSKIYVPIREIEDK